MLPTTRMSVTFQNFRPTSLYVFKILVSAVVYTVVPSAMFLIFKILKSEV